MMHVQYQGNDDGFTVTVTAKAPESEVDLLFGVDFNSETQEFTWTFFDLRASHSGEIRTLNTGTVSPNVVKAIKESFSRQKSHDVEEFYEEETQG